MGGGGRYLVLFSFQIFFIQFYHSLLLIESDAISQNLSICYGLRTDFRSHLFPGAQQLMELADDIEQIRTICWCGKRAHFNARLLNGEIVTEGEQVQLGGNES